MVGATGIEPVTPFEAESYDVRVHGGLSPMIKSSDLIKSAIGGALGFSVGNFAYYYPDWAVASNEIVRQ